MKKQLLLTLLATDDTGKVYGKIEAFSLETLEEKLHHIEKVISEHSLVCDICGQDIIKEQDSEISDRETICVECQNEENENN